MFLCGDGLGAGLNCICPCVLMYNTAFVIFVSLIISYSVLGILPWLILSVIFCYYIGFGIQWFSYPPFDLFYVQFFMSFVCSFDVYF